MSMPINVLDLVHRTNAIGRMVKQESFRATDDLTPEEKEESKAAHAQVMTILGSLLKHVDKNLQKVKVDTAANNSVSAAHSDGGPGSGAFDIDPVQFDLEQLSDGGTPVSPVTALLDTMSGKSPNGISSQSKSMSKMAESIEPIISSFNAVLSKPYLKNYNATLNTVPIIGLKGNQVMYTQTQSIGVGVTEVWSIFSTLPLGVNINSSNAVHFFPYKGDFCMSIGTAIWRKKHRSENDPELKHAVDNWSKLYVDNWEKIGDNCLPDSNLKSIIPYATLSSDRKVLKSELLILDQSAKLSVLVGDDLVGDNIFEEVKNVSKTDSEGAKIKMAKAAYWNGSIVAYDTENNTWNLDLNVPERTFTAADKFSVQPLTEFTATDVGPVGVRKDGFLYKRVIQEVKDPKDGEPPSNLVWQQWIKQDGVTHLGVASPGVILDLETLTKHLKSRYLDTQKALYPVVSKMATWATTHGVFLDSLSESAAEYAKTEGVPAKQKLAIKEAKKYVNNARIWAKIMRSQTEASKTTVNLMGDDIGSVKAQLSQELQRLRDSLKQLESQLKVYKETEIKLKRAFWASVVTAVLGLGLAILAVVTGVGIVLAAAGGALFIGGLVAAGMFGSKWADITKTIALIESQIAGVTTAIAQLEVVVAGFEELQTMYEALNGFWGKMFNSASTLVTMDQATAAQLGESVLEDMSSIDAAKKTTKQIRIACETYLAVLNRTGVKMQRDPDSDDEADLGDVLASNDVVDVHPGMIILSGFNSNVETAQIALKSRDFEAYERYMEAADLVETQQMMLADNWFEVFNSTQPNGLNAKTSEKTNADGGEEDSMERDFSNSIVDGVMSAAKLSGIISNWFNPVALHSQVSFFNTAIPFNPAVEEAHQLNSDLLGARYKVNEMLDNTLEFSRKTQEWATQIPDLPTTPADVQKATEARSGALRLCRQAQDSAILANNLFSDFNQRATAVWLTLQSRIQANEDQITALRKQIEDTKRQMESPLWLDLITGPISRIVGSVRIAEAIQPLNQKIGMLAAEAGLFQHCLQSGLVYQNQSQSWVQVCTQTSENLGAICNTLEGLRLEIRVDHEIYKQLATTQWASLTEHVNQVRALIGSTQQNFGAADLGTASDNGLADSRTLGDQSCSSLISAISPSPALHGTLILQTDNAKSVWASLARMNEVYFTNDMVAFWDPKGNRKVSLLDVIATVRQSYVSMAATQYNTIQQVNTFALIQGTRANNAASGKISSHIFLKYTFNSIANASKDASRTANHYQAVSSELAGKLAATKYNIYELKKAIVSAKSELNKREQAYRDKVTGIIIKAALTGFATGGLVTAACAAAYLGVPLASLASVVAAGGALAGGTRRGEGKDDERKSGTNGDEKLKQSEDDTEDEDDDEVNDLGDDDDDDDDDDRIEVAKPGAKNEKNVKDKVADYKKRIEAAQTTWTGLSGQIRKAKDLAAATTIGRALFNKLTLEELATLVSMVQVAVVVMDRALKTIEEIQAPLDRLIDSIVGIAENLKIMDDDCKQFARDMDPKAQVYISKEDAQHMEKQWNGVAEASEAWLDVFNAQGISPISSALLHEG